MLLYADEDIRKAKQILDNLEDRNLKVMVYPCIQPNGINFSITGF